MLAYFTHPITNAVAEGLNSKIQAIKRAARGFRALAAYRFRILFYCGLDMRPRFTNSETHGISRRTAEEKVVFWVFFLRVAGCSLNTIFGMHLSHGAGHSNINLLKDVSGLAAIKFMTSFTTSPRSERRPRSLDLTPKSCISYFAREAGAEWRQLFFQICRLQLGRVEFGF